MCAPSECSEDNSNEGKFVKPPGGQGLVAVVDDEQDILELVRVHLEKAGFTVETFQEAGVFLSFLETQTPRAIILDLMLPDRDGLEVCRYLKNSESLSEVPVIILTARGEESDRILGLELGADDYVSKPFSPKELTARVRTVIRRRIRAGPESRISVGGILTMDPRRHEVTVSGRNVELTPVEFRILHMLASRIGWVYSRDKILFHLWGNDKSVTARTVDVHIRNLRRKLGTASRLVRNVRGVGYKLSPWAAPHEAGE